MIGMVGEVGTPGENAKPSTEEEIKLLEEEFKNLQDQTQDLINERAHMESEIRALKKRANSCLLYTSPSPRDGLLSRMPSSA